MNDFDTHICLVSAQATPNLLPLLDAQWKPRKVVLACSAQMKDAAQNLQSVIQTKGGGITVEMLLLPNAYDYAALSEVFLNYLAHNPNEKVALNVTGGTKLMAVAAQEVFRAEKKPVFYVNVETDEVLLIGSDTPSQPLKTKLRVHELLRAHGYQVNAANHPQVTGVMRDLTARLIDHVASAGPALGALNALAHNAKRSPTLKAELNDQQRDSRSLNDLLTLFIQAGLLQHKSKSLIFKDEEARFFTNGGWLEWHVYEVLQSLRSQHEGLSDVAMGLRVAFADGNTKNDKKDKNEIDVAFLYRNTLHLIECKTANLEKAGIGNDDKATEAIYKMESLLKLGGLRTKGMVVDYRGALTQSKANLERASEAKIAIASGNGLKDLKGLISRLWLSKPKSATA